MPSCAGRSPVAPLCRAGASFLWIFGRSLVTLKNQRFCESRKIKKNGPLNRTLRVQGSFLDQKTSAAPHRVQGVLNLEAESEPEIAGPGGACPRLTSPPAPKRALWCRGLGLYASKFRIIFLHRFWSILFPSFFDRKTFTMGPGRPLDRPKSLLNDFSIDFGSILEPISHEKYIKKSMHFSCLKKS